MLTRTPLLLSVLLCLLLFALPTAAGAGSTIAPTSINLTSVVSASSPIGVRHAGDGSGRLFIIERAGRIQIFNGVELLGSPFLDISGQVSTAVERGLLGLAFHPDYATNGFFYVHYNNNSGASVISRFSVSAGDPNDADEASETILLTVPQPAANHNGGDIAFGADGHLYATIGDGGGSGDTGNNAQTITNLLGTIVRLTDSGGIPAGNPFVGITGEDEIWSYGLRNPYRFSFDRHTGDMWIGDVGQGAWEEVDFEIAGATGGRNWGWRCYEGNAVFNFSLCDPKENYYFPVFVYSHSLGNAITGGFRYRGFAGGPPHGWYFYADSGSGRIWGGRQDGDGDWITTELLNTPNFLVGFGEDEEGNVYVVDLSGQIFRIDGNSLYGNAFELGDTTGWDEVVAN